MYNWPLLSLLIFLPLVGAFFIILIRGDDDVVARNSKYLALWTTLINFIISLLLWFQFDTSTSDFQFVEQATWLSEDITYHLGIDGISMLFIILSTFLMPICILASWNSINTRVREYMVAFLVMETAMVGVFSSLDFVLFYIFFEGGLIPMFLIIGIWGGGNRIYATFKFFLYTLVGSLLMLLAILVMYFDAGTTDIPSLINYIFDPSLQKWLWLAFFASFAVKIPMWPVHTWLPDAHVEAPTAGSVILAAVLLKMGGYGFLRFSIPMLPDATQFFTPLVFVLSVIAIIYASLVALMQTDMKKLVAYSSVAHMGFVTIGIFTFSQQGIEGGIFQMISHGLISGALFLSVGVVYDRIHSREINRYGGLVNRMPKYAFLFLLFTLANVGLPGTSGFVGEFLVLVGVFQINTWIALFATLGVVLSAAYALWLYRRVIFGSLDKEDLKNIIDLKPREIITLLPLALAIIFFGVYPQPLLEIMHVSVENLINQHLVSIGKYNSFMFAGN
ncbi:NADH-quinone oxidoreductase subunit M [Alphaproteobacteria bacterium]|nr:NADH-quinone oxidoreductase subunit M [Alphaproteobacteria bacterium]